MKTALLIIDVQNDYFPGGKMELDGSIEAAGHIQSVIEAFRKKNDPIIYIQHISKKENAPFFVENTEGVEIYEGIKPAQDEKVIIKHFPNSFRETELLQYCENTKITDFVITGMMTHMCIDTTTRAAFDSGFNCTLLGDCCTTRNLEYNGETILSSSVQKSFLAALNGTFCTVINTEEYLNSHLAKSH